MKYLALRKAARKECANRMRAILDKAVEGDNARNLTEEERAEVDQLREMIDEHDRVIKELMEDEERMGDHDDDREGDENDRGDEQPPGIRNTDAGDKGSAPNTRAATREQRARPDLWKGKLNDRMVKVGHEPGVYEKLGERGFGVMLLDQAIHQSLYSGDTPEFNAQSSRDRILRHEKEMAVMTRDTLTADLPGIVIPAFDPAMISRGIEEYGVTLALLDHRPLPAKGDSLTLPRVTTVPTTSAHTEGSDFAETQIRTSAVKADLYENAARAPISLRAIERGYSATELLMDEIIRAWVQQANWLVNYGRGARANQPLEPTGLLVNNTERAGQFLVFTDAAPTAVKYLDQLTRSKGRVFKDDKRRVTAHVVNEEAMTWFETAKAGDQYLIPPFANWAYNAGGAGTLPEAEGVMSEMSWRRVPVYVDTGITNTAGAGSNESHALSMVRDEMPIFHEGPRSFQFDQTLAASGEHLIVVRGYSLFNPMWRPEAWKVLSGTGTIIPSSVLLDEFLTQKELDEKAADEASDAAKAAKADAASK